MEKKYVICSNQSISEPMSREEAIHQVKRYSQQGISAYIVSQEEGERIKKSKFEIPKWN